MSLGLISRTRVSLQLEYFLGERHGMVGLLSLDLPPHTISLIPIPTSEPRRRRTCLESLPADGESASTEAKWTDAHLVVSKLFWPRPSPSIRAQSSRTKADPGDRSCVLGFRFTGQADCRRYARERRSVSIHECPCFGQCVGSLFGGFDACGRLDARVPGHQHVRPDDAPRHVPGHFARQRRTAFDSAPVCFALDAA